MKAKTFKRKAATVLSTSEMLRATAKWYISRFAPQHPQLKFDGVKIGHFTSFSEYWNYRSVCSPEDIATFTACARQYAGGVAFDVGANIGLVSLLLANFGCSHTYSFEPVPITHQRLLKNIALNPRAGKRIIPVPLALGEAPGEIDFAVFPDSYGQSKIYTPDCDGPTTQIIRVSVSTIDSFCRQHSIGDVSFLKIDVEGREVDVLLGARQQLAEKRVKSIYLEVIPLALTNAGRSERELFELLHSFGYSSARLSGYGTVRQCSLESAVEEARNTRNMLFAVI